MVRFPLGGLLDACMQEANIRNSFDDYFAIDGQDEAQHAMGTGMLRPHIDGHCIDALPILSDLAILNGVYIFYFLLLHIASWFCLAPTRDATTFIFVSFLDM